ncbi:hypothetical protein HHK36_003627 [Tetracentron sinense]|uniref:HSF-type DNA-binding domain-containing protein n=1 Tax=Tetracentron sinense TaxID=13715 RepID=A0A835DNS9_TETSI|nr:hypothetical protein HHK36_003627 [Tetracentron sinense]
MMDGSQSGSSVPPPFLTKTYEMVDDPSINSIVSWSQSNNSFVVWSPPEFEGVLLPKYFKHKNFSSFVRQLNTYGFRKIDPEQWEFSNKDFVRGQRHLLKNIHRRKPIHSHSGQNPQGQENSSGALVDLEKHELQEEIERLKQDKSLLVLELQTLIQEQQRMELQIQYLEGNLHQMEDCQRQIMFFLTRILQKSGFVSNFMQQSKNNSKKRRLPNHDYFYDESNMEENQILNFQMVTREKPDTISMPVLNMEPFEKLESSINYWENFFCLVGQASGEEMYSVEVPSHPSVGVLTEMHYKSIDSGINMQPQSPKLNSFSLCSRDIHSSPDLAESMNYDESPIISSVQLNVDAWPNSCTIDVNSKPDPPPEVEASKEQALRTKTSVVLTGVNDVFWEQLLTEIPGSSDTPEVQLERRDTDGRKTESKTGDRKKFWCNMKNVDNLTEQMGQLNPTERTNVG